MDSDEFFFDLAPSVRPPTVLYGIEPAEVGSGYVESLAGYMIRLASTHKVSLDTLVHELVTHYADSQPSSDYMKCFGSRDRLNVVGLGNRASAWTALLSGLVGRNDLNHCTMTWANDVLSEFGLLSKSYRYCRLCMEEHERVGTEPFNRLLWHIGSVTACPIHKVQLLEARCGVRSKTTPSAFARRAGAGHCKSCGAIAYRCDTQPLVPATAEEEWIAGQVVDLLAYGASVKRLWRKNLVRGIKALVASNANGKPAVLARKCGLPKSTIWTLAKHDSTTRVSLPSLLQISSVFGYSLVSILNGEPLRESNVPLIDISFGPHGKVPSEDIKNCIQDVLGLKVPFLSVKGVAEKFGVSERTIVQTFPELVKALRIATAEHWIRVRTESKRQIEDECQMILRQLSNQGRASTLRNAAKITGKRWPTGSSQATIFIKLRTAAESTESSEQQRFLEGRA